MPKRKLDKQSAFKDFLEDLTPTRRSKLRKLDQQDITISPSCARLPISRPFNSKAKMRERQHACKLLQRPCNEIDQLAVRFSFLSLEMRLPFKAPSPTFPKFPLLPTEIRLMIWKLSRPDSRIIKLSASKRVRPSALDLDNLCWMPYDHVVSRTPPPNLLHACFESRDIALKWYRLFFQPRCGDGGTYFDTERDYLYYGPDEIKLLVDPGAPTPTYREQRYGNLWLQDRQAIPNIMVHLTEELDGTELVLKLLTTARWCNELAKNVLLLGHRSSDVKEGTMLSDLGRDVSNFKTSTPDTVRKVECIKRFLNVVRTFEPFWENFRPKRMVSVALFGTHNVEQSYGFTESWHLDARAYFGVSPPSAFDIEEEDLVDYIPLN